MFRRRKQFGLRRKRYRTPFTGSSYLYAADMEYRGRATTLACGPVAVGEVIVTPVEWRNGSQLIQETASIFILCTYPVAHPDMPSVLGAPCSQSRRAIIGYVIGTATSVSYFRQWCTEFVTRIAPSVLNIIDARGVENLYALKTVGEGGPRFLEVLNDLKDRLSDNIQGMSAQAMIAATRAIWGICNTVTISSSEVTAYVHIPFTYLARSKPPRAVQRRGVWVFAKSQLRHELSAKAAEKGVKKYGVRTSESVFDENFAQVDGSREPVPAGDRFIPIIDAALAPQ